MPRELFGDVTDPSITLGTRKWYSVPLSFLVHALVISVLVITPLLATGALPLPDSGPTFVHIEPPPLPQPPPVRAVTPAAAPAVSPDAAPVVAPDEITKEPDIDLGFEAAMPAPVGIVGGTDMEISGAVVAPPVAEPTPSEPVRVGGIVRPPQRVAYVAPAYPALALTARVQGLVIIEATIDTSGHVRAARVLRSDSPVLNEEALAAVRQWTYTPTLLNGVPVSVVMTVTVHFRLQ
ncbi:MAG TPA: energy transducer TonB [Vicinamibacterales bacterium]|nr:energy transducer TonB [Vicinamibacterales bacterium]